MNPFLFIISCVIMLVVFFIVKHFVWDKPHEEIISLRCDLEKLKLLHNEEITKLNDRLQNSDDLQIIKSEYVDIVFSYAVKELSELCNKEYANLGINKGISPKDQIKKRFSEAITDQYKFIYLSYLFPEINKVFDGTRVKTVSIGQPTTIGERSNNLFDVVDLLNKNINLSHELIYWKNRVNFLEASRSNLTAIPYMAGIMADYETYGIEHLAKELDWGYAMKRMDKVKSIREIRKDAQTIVEKNKEAQYQLAYLLKLYPALEDVIDAEFSQLPVVEVEELSEYDKVRDYLSKEEYASLSETDRNQLALDRYKNSHNRTKWQIGRDYELFVGYMYSKKGYDVDYFGSYMGLSDLGRDLIVKKCDEILIVQCKYWSSKKQIHENHINQLYGTLISYCIENSIDKKYVKGVLITNIELSPTAKKMANYLNIHYIEHFEVGDYPCIKCNIGRGDNGEITKIYHLPFDQQYDNTKINNKGEFYAISVAEAEAAGFRRAHKWIGN